MSEHTDWRYSRFSYVLLAMAIFASVVALALVLLTLALAGVGFVMF